MSADKKTKEKIHKKAKLIRQSFGLSQEKFAVLTGVSQAAVSRIERGERIPRKATMKKIGLVSSSEPLKSTSKVGGRGRHE